MSPKAMLDTFIMTSRGLSNLLRRLETWLARKRKRGYELR
jgi:hypothetical protein